ncbi:MAG: hypothetical protein Kow0042_03870 [Calditrichia bacterium]
MDRKLEDISDSRIDSAYRFFSELLLDNQTVLGISWNRIFPMSDIFRKACIDNGIPTLDLERGLFPGTMMLEPEGIAGLSFLINSNDLEQRIEYYNQQSEHPYFEKFLEKYKAGFITKRTQAPFLEPEELRKKYDIPAEQKLLFFAGQADADAGLFPPGTSLAWRQSPNYANTYVAMEATADAIRQRKDAALIFKPHPTDRQFETAKERFSSIIMVKEENLHSLILASDAVVNMASTVGMEAMLLDKPVISLARSQLSGRGIFYEPSISGDLDEKIELALCKKYFRKKREQFAAFSEFLLKHYFFNLSTSGPARQGCRELAFRLIQFSKNQNFTEFILNGDILMPGKPQNRIVKSERVTKKKPLVSIVIPVFNQVDYTRNCLQELYKNTSTDIDIEVIVVDNGSTDETPDFLKQAKAYYPGLKIVTNEKNLGFAKACNIGAKTAEGKYLLFLNNDTEPQPGWLEEMLKIFQENPDAGIVGSKLLYPDGTVQHAGIEFHYRIFGDKKIPWPYHEFRGVKPHFGPVDEFKEVTAVTGACMMIEKTLFEEVNGLDESYPMYFEDLDLNMKVSEKGKKIYYTPRSVVIHHEGKSSAKQAEIDELNLRSAAIFLNCWKSQVQKQLAADRQVQNPVVWTAPFFNPSGYASEAIGFALGLDKYTDLQIYHDNPLRSEKFIQNMPAHWRETLTRLHNNDPTSSSMRVPAKFIHISHQPGHSLKRLPNALYNIGRTMFETDRLPVEWLDSFHEMDEIWVPSRFNYDTFSRHGVPAEKLRIIPEGIDTDVFDPQGVEPLPLPDRTGFNFLSIFEWTERKGWDILLRAYFEAFTNKDDVCLYLRTYLLSHYDRDTTAHIQAKIDGLIRRYGYKKERLPRYKILAEQLPFMDMLRLYKAADAFVLPSRGEGWGRPYMEAMCMELPVIATNWSGNTAFMNEENAYLIKVDRLEEIKKMEMDIYLGHQWARPSKNHLKSLMQEVFQNQERAREKARNARQHIIKHYSLDAVARIAVNRLREIEADLQMPAPRKSSTLKPADHSINILWEGAQFVNHSLAVVNREMCLRLLEAGCNLSLVPFERDQFKPAPGSRMAKLGDCVRKKLEQVDVHVRHQWPPKLLPPRDGHWVIIQPWEFGSLPKKWVDVFSTLVDELWVPTRFVKNVYVESGVPAERVQVIPNGIDPEKFNPAVKPFPLKTRKRFKFLFLGGTIYRKGIDILIESYVQAFTRKDDVCLVIKDMGGNSFYRGQTMRENIRELQSRKDVPEIEYIEEILPETDLIGLYTACDVLVHPYRGEGFGLPILEAMACGTAVMVTAGGASDDFCNESNSIQIPAKRVTLKKKKVDYLETVDYPWLLEPDIEVLQEKMRWAVENPAVIRELGRKARAEVSRQWTWEKSAEKIIERIKYLKTRPIRREIIGDESWLQGKLNEANEASSNQEFEKATAILREVRQYFPAHPQVLYVLGQIQFQKGDYEAALDSLIQCIRNQPDHVAAQVLYGEVLRAAGEWQAAIETFLTILNNHPDSVTAAVRLGELYTDTDQLEKAGKIFSQLLPLNPVEPQVLEAFLNYSRKGGDLTPLENLLNTINEIAPIHAPLFNELGVMKWRAEDFDRAVHYFETAVALNGEYPEHVKNLADAYISLEQFEKGIQLLRYLIHKYPTDFEAYEKLANLYVEDGNFTAAQDLIQNYLQTQPDNDYARTMLELLQTPQIYVAYLLLNQGEIDEAEKLFISHLEQEPNALPARLGLGSIRFHQQNWEAARKIYTAILQESPGQEEALWYLSEIYLLNEDRKSFEQLYQANQHLFEKSAALGKVYLEFLIQYQREEEALKILDVYIKRYPDDSDAFLLAGILSYRQGRLPEALNYFVRAYNMNPNNEIIRENLRLVRSEIEPQEALLSDQPG